MSITATPIGVNDVTSISRRLIMPKIYDNVYKSNAAFFRLNAMDKIEEQGGFQIEVPVLYADILAGGPYSGFDVLDVSPNDTIFNLAFPWSQYYVPVSIDGLSLARADGPDPVANLVKTKLAQADLSLRNRLGSGLWSVGTNANDMVGLPLIVDNGTLEASYGGVSRTTYPFLKAQIDSSTTTLTFAAMQSLFGSCTFGGRSPSIGFSTQAQYNVYWGLLAGQSGGQYFPVQPGGTNEQLAQAGFSNLLFNGVPILVDSHVPTVTANGKFYFLNEDFITLIVHSRVNMYLEDFQTPINQDAMTAKILWYGQIVCGVPQSCGKFTDLSA